MTKKKKIFVLVTMVLVLAVAAYLNIALLTQNSSKEDDVFQNANFFTSYRTERQETRKTSILELDNIIATKGDEFIETRKEAMENKAKLIEIIETEMLLEHLIKAKGYSDAVVTMGLTSGNINVAIRADELARGDTAKIYSIIHAETQKGIDFVKFQPVK